MGELWVIDIECSKNFFSLVAMKYGTKEGLCFEISERVNHCGDIKTWLDAKPILIGYNNLTYDNPMIVAASMGYSNRKLYNLSQKLIEAEGDKERWETVSKYNYDGKSIDLMRLLFSKKLRVSLKSLMVTLKWERVQDLPFSPYEKIPVDRFDEVLDYNYNDVAFTEYLTYTVRDQLNLRVEIEKKYGLNVMSKDGVATGISLLYTMLGKPDGKRPRPNLKLSECIVDSVKFQSSEFNNFLERIKNYQEVRYSEKLTFCNKVYSYGIGGLHTEDSAGVYTAGGDEVFIDADVTSYYPSIVIKYGLYPEHLGRRFVETYEQLFNTRLDAKRSGDTITSETFKLALNGCFGNFNNGYSWLYDPKVFFTITLSGQLLLSMLCERMELNDFEVLSANTDGVTVRVKKSRFNDFVAICRGWEIDSKMNLEYTLFNKIVRRDVNCYYAVGCDREGKSNGKVKEKGAWLRDTGLGKSYRRPIENIALYEYFINNTPPEKTIFEHGDIYDFCMSTRVGKQYDVEYKGLPAQRINRYYVSTSSEAGNLIKIRRDTGQRISLVAGENVMLFNDFVSKDDYEIDYSYYIREVRKIIDRVELTQLQLF